jgi:hypothetical protein
MNHRDRKLLDLAHEVEVCQFRLPGVCNIGQPDGCEPAHSNNLTDGKGTGIKAHDFRHVAACHACHVEYDNGKLFSREQKRVFFNDGWQSTMTLYFLNGWLGVSR